MYVTHAGYVYKITGAAIERVKRDVANGTDVASALDRHAKLLGRATAIDKFIGN